MESFGAFRKQPVDIIFPFDLFFRRESLFGFNDRDFSTDIGNQEDIAVLLAELAEKITSFVGEVDRSGFFIDGVKEFVIDLLHPACVIFQVLVFNILDKPCYSSL